MADPLAVYAAAPYGSPFSLQCAMLGVQTAAAEGLWVPSQFCKNASVEVFGTSTSFSIALLGTNQLEPPLNAETATVSGSISTGDVIVLKVTNQNLPGGSASVSYTTIGGDTTTTIAAALAGLLASSSALNGMGLLASSSGAVITMSFPSAFPGPGAGGQYPSNLANVSTFSFTTTGSESIAFAGVTSIGSAIGSAITALGVTTLTAIPRWLRARLTSIGNGNVGVNFAGAG